MVSDCRRLWTPGTLVESQMTTFIESSPSPQVRPPIPTLTWRITVHCFTDAQISVPGFSQSLTYSVQSRDEHV